MGEGGGAVESERVTGRARVGVAENELRFSSRKGAKYLLAIKPLPEDPI